MFVFITFALAKEKKLIKLFINIHPFYHVLFEQVQEKI